MQEEDSDGSPLVLVTRPDAGGERLLRLLRDAGVRAEHVPVLEVRAPEDPAALLAAAREAAGGGYDWVALTSANGVRALAEGLREAGAGAPRARIACVGEATERASLGEGWAVDLVPGTYTAEGLLEALRRTGVAGARILLPIAERAGDVLPEGLRAAGAIVEVVVAYRTRPPNGMDGARIRARLGSGEVALTTLASPSAAEALLDLVGEAALAVPVAVVGPVTRDAARALGYRVVAVADPHTSEGLVGAVIGWLSQPRPVP